MDDALGRGGGDHQPQLLQRERGRVKQLADVVGHVGVDSLVSGGRDRVALDQRAASKGALQRLGRALQADVGLGGREDDARCRLGFGLADLNEIARADAGIGALQPVQADDVDALVFAIGTDRAGGGRALADDLDHVAFVQAELVHQLVGQPGKAAAAVSGWQARDLNLARSHAIDCICFRHLFS